MHLKNWSIWALLALLVLFAATGCNKGLCEDYVCQNGLCLEGTCVCDSFFEGPSCDVLETSKFLGDWTVGDICNNGSDVYDASISAAAAQGRIRIDAFGPDRLPVFAEVRGDTVNIYDQAYGLAIISGAGGIDTVNQAITLDYNVDFGQGNSVNCLTSLGK